MKRLFCGILSLLLCLPLLSACAGKEPSPTLPAKPTEGSSRVTLAAVGDIYLTDSMLQSASSASGSYDFISLFGDTVNTIAAADIALGNLEGSFAGSPYTDGSYPDELAAALGNAGFDLLQTANSYSIQNGLSGLRRTKSVIEGEKLSALGTFSSAEDFQNNCVTVREINGIRIAFVAFTKGLGSMSVPSGAEYCVNLLYSDYNGNYSRVDTDGIVAVLNQAKLLQPDVIVAALHWGSEDTSEISKTQQEIADLMLRNGVDVIIGSHSHRAGEIERRTVYSASGTSKETVIAYSLGDYCAVEDGGMNVSLILRLEFTRDHASGVTTITDVGYTPIATVDLGAEAKQRFAVLNMDNAIDLYESNYYDRVSAELYEDLVAQREKLEQALFPPEEEKE